jgi:DNA-binding MarR family transcriptional regulator
METPAPRHRHEHEGPHLFREIVRTHQAVMEAFSREVGMSGARLAVLRQVAVDGEAGVADLARALGVTPAMVTRRVQELERDGLLVRRGDERDGRRTWVRLTRRGMATFERLHERAHAIEEALMEGVTAEDLAVAARVLVAVREKLGSRRRSGPREES